MIKFKFAILFFLVLLSKFIFADVTIGPVGKEHLKTVKEYKVDNNHSIFLYKYSPPFPPHTLTVLLAKDCNCERDKVFYADEEGILFSYDNDTGEYSALKAKGFLGVLYSGAGDIYEKITVDNETIRFSILVNDIHQYREPNVKLIKADLLKFKWGKKGDKYQVLEKTKEVIVVDNLSENEEDSPPKKDVSPILNKNGMKPTKSASGSISLIFQIFMLSLLVLRLSSHDQVGNTTQKF